MAERSSGPRPVVIVKLGGSVITRKREVERLRPKLLERLAREATSSPDLGVVVLHGAGSFGHPGARRFGLARAPPSLAPPQRERARGAAIVSAEVRRLHLEVLRALLRAHGSPFSVPIATHAENAAGRLRRIDPRPFQDALAAGLQPVSFGDVVRDSEWGFSILSADTIAISLAETLRPQRVIFVSDVPGIYVGASGPRRTVAEEVTGAIVEALRPTGGALDVTGGIRGKAEAMLAIARGGTDAGLISGLSDGALARAIRGEAVYGSWAHSGSR